MSQLLFAQEPEKVRDSTSTAISLGALTLPNPDSIVSKYEYDPSIQRYIYSEKLGEFNIRYPLFLTPEEFEVLVAREQSTSYFKEKMAALQGRSEDAEQKQKNLLPIFYVNSKFFESVFGGSEIEIIPQGSVEMDLGGLFTKIDNPALSPRNRTNFTFDFDQRISLSLLGKIGKRLQITANYDTESTFDFQNQFKFEYTPTEDDIIRSIEVGNVTMPLNSSLIQGAQSLFGFKVGMQFGNTTITGVFSEQNSETQSVSVQGGGTVADFELFALDYDENRHFFLSHYFRDTYDASLQNYPFINSNIQITRMEVWVTNRATSSQSLASARNIVALEDLGESPVVGNVSISAALFNQPAGALPSNENNQLDPFAISAAGPITEAIRQVATVQQGFIGGAANFNEGFDYAILENARQLTPNEYTYHNQLGYISLNQRLNNDEVLAVAFQYTKGDQVYQVGEFSADGIDATIGQNNADPNTPTAAVGSSQSLVVKMLKSPITNVNRPIWDLMMKNIYNTGAFRLEREDFKLNILYTNPSPVNYITAAPNGGLDLPPKVESTRLLTVFNMDRLNPNNDPVQGADGSGDGFFDFVPGLTVDTDNGRIIFSTVEPFGEHLFDLLDNGSTAATYNIATTYNPNQAQYVFRDLYTQTKVVAEQQSANKNFFQLKGTYKSSGQDGIPLGAFNVPQGSVTVTAGGRVLQEGADYSVNYQLGRVIILDESLKASNTPIQISTENNAVFGQQTKRFSGIHMEHQFSEDFMLGGTFLNLNERPITQKSSYNFEPINNSILGLQLNYATEVPFLTRLVNKLPNIDTDVPSSIAIRGEVARLIAGAPSGADFDGKVTSYIDDFEGAQTAIDVSSPISWELSSVPLGFENNPNPTTNPASTLPTGYKRAKISWYTIDPTFYSNSRPSGITDTDLSSNATRRIFNAEIFPDTDNVPGQTLALFPLNIQYDPLERGPYNYNPNYLTNNNQLPNPDANFGGIIRRLTATNFEQSNVEFIEFWLLDPFYDGGTSPTAPLTEATNGKIVFNLGNISEDVLQDGRKQYENGLPTTAGNANTLTTSFGNVPVNQSLVYTFDSQGADRTLQDVGYDGLNDQAEKLLADIGGFANFSDPSADNYQFFLQGSGNVIDRYANYNGVEGDSPTNVTNDNRGRVAHPTVEDVNRDNTMNTINSYYEYEIPIFAGMGVGNDNNTDYITDVRQGSLEVSDGNTIGYRWFRFKVPIYKPTNSFNISDFRSIRFMRMYITDFDKPTTLRFGTLDLIRGDYRRYVQLGNTTNDPTSGLNVFGDANVLVTSISEEETPNYVSPPGVRREELANNNSTIREDERSLALGVTDLQNGDSRGVYKNFNVDMRQYENFELFLHAEPLLSSTLDDNALTAFVRMGNDFTNNFYQIELPLQVSQLSDRDQEVVWPTANRIDLPLDFLQEVKTKILGNDALLSTELNFFDGPNSLKVGMKGNPNYGDIRVMMVGVKNTSGQSQSGTVWFNEMRISDLKNRGGWATIGSFDGNIADFATLNASGKISTIGFGGIEQGPNARSREDFRQYDVTTNLNLGQLLPKKWSLQIPFNYSRGEEIITPQFDPQFLDIELEDRIANEKDPFEKNKIRSQSINYTKRQSVNVIGLRKDRTENKKARPYDIENFSLSGTYNQTDHHDFETENALDQSVLLGATYDFNFQPLDIRPFKKVKFLNKSGYFNLIKDFNFNPLPTSIAASANINRQFNQQIFRDITRGPNDLPTPALTQRNFLFDWQYTINHNLSKSLNFSFNATNNRIIKNFIDAQGNVDESIGIWSGLTQVGDPNFHSTKLQLNYQLPLNKIPLFKFIRATYSYAADFQWTKGSEALRSLNGFDLGNTVQNGSIHTVNGSLDMQSLYKYVGLTKKKKARNKTRKKNNNTKKGTKESSAKNKKNKPIKTKLTIADKIFNTGIGLLTAVKKVNFNYQQDNGIFLPGYLRSPGFIGTLKPSPWFIFGSQAEIRTRAAQEGWLTRFPEFNQQYRKTHGEQYNIQASVRLLKNLTIDISANRSYSETFSENYRIDSNTNRFTYVPLSPNTFGNFSISTNLIATAFQNSNSAGSKAFAAFRNNRISIANRLATARGINPFIDSDSDGFVDADGDKDGFPDGFGGTNQAILLPAFLAAYTGQNIENTKTSPFTNIPLPNWDIKYTGLMQIKWFKKRFKRFSLAHGYHANYTINQFQTNLDFEPDSPNRLDQNGNFKNPFLYNIINLTEQFSPLLRVDMEMKNAIKVLAELKKDRALSLSFANNLLTEVHGNTYTLGLGYRLKDLKITTRMGGKKKVLKGDLNFRADLSLRQNETLIRYLDINSSQITAGQDIYSFKLTSDYALSKNLTALFFYDHTFSRYAISTAFPQTTIRGGFTLRYNFGN